eukprot:3613105-Rhodomonas_salina.2
MKTETRKGKGRGKGKAGGTEAHARGKLLRRWLIRTDQHHTRIASSVLHKDQEDDEKDEETEVERERKGVGKKEEEEEEEEEETRNGSSVRCEHGERGSTEGVWLTCTAYLAAALPIIPRPITARSNTSPPVPGQGIVMLVSRRHHKILSLDTLSSPPAAGPCSAEVQTENQRHRSSSPDSPPPRRGVVCAMTAEEWNRDPAPGP